jgi:NADPH-dependent 2,4-dienoyl-CoA reductase/sulfur reductase-like enzyme
VYAAGDVAETPNRVTGKHDTHAIFPNAVTQGRLVAYNLLEWNIPYEGAENMNSLKHLGIPVIVAGEMEGEQLGVRRDDLLRRLYLQDNHIIGFQLAGNIRGAGIFRALMNKKVEVGFIKERLIAPGFGIGYISDQNLFSNSGKYPIL